MGQPKPPVPPFGSGVRMRGTWGCPGGGQIQGAGAAAVAQGVGDEFGDDQDHRVGGLGCERRLETFEELPGAVACAGYGCRRAEGCDFDARRIHQGAPRSLDRRRPVLSARSLCPGCGPLTRVIPAPITVRE
ncbi:hypothetical protein GCM10010272_54820 [Streptomyces lateritius]|nr:hypothetical protein GCM10010272_54820 [Streptomyces lateritius]